MIALTCEYLGFSVGAKTILKGVSFSLNEGDKMGIVGVNGAGKSTLLRMIAGTCEPSEGAVYLRKSATLEMLNQNDMVEEEKTPYEVLLSSCTELGDAEKRLEELSSRMVTGDEEASLCHHSLHERFLELGGYEYKGRIKGILRSLGFSEEQMNTPSGILSGGQKTRLALARILYKSPDILILDEPTNHLDIDGREALIRALNEYKGSVILIAHDMHLVELVADTLWLVKDGTCKPYDGDLSEYRNLLLQPDKPADKKALPQPEPRQSKGDTRAEKKAAVSRLRRVEREIEKLEEQKKLLEAAFEQLLPTEEIIAKQKDLAWIDNQLNAFEEEWFELSAKLEK